MTSLFQILIQIVFYSEMTKWHQNSGGFPASRRRPIPQGSLAITALLALLCGLGMGWLCPQRQTKGAAAVLPTFPLITASWSVCFAHLLSHYTPQIKVISNSMMGNNPGVESHEDTVLMLSLGSHTQGVMGFSPVTVKGRINLHHLPRNSEGEDKPPSSPWSFPSLTFYHHWQKPSLPKGKMENYHYLTFSLPSHFSGPLVGVIEIKASRVTTCQAHHHQS